MSTVPHDVPDAINAKSPTTVLHEMGRDPDLDAAVRHFASTADGLAARRPASDELTKMIYQLAALTRALFPGKLVVETGVDPEIRDDVCLLFQADASGSVGEILSLNDQWHRRALSIAPEWPGLFRLSIDAH
jgi:hypothetical protein